MANDCSVVVISSHDRSDKCSKSVASNSTKPKLVNTSTGKTRRGLKKRSYNKDQSKLSIFGNNCDGIKNKVESLKVNVTSFSPSIVTLQETKLKSKNSFKIPGYQFFERLRCQKDGGGLLTAIDENLDPVLVFSNEGSLLEIKRQSSHAVLRDKGAKLN